MADRTVTIYIPCYNAEKYIKECLEAVFKQTYPVDEVLVIDDGSTDGTVRAASQFPVKIVRHDGNKGLAAARNTGFRNARNEFVGSLDSDCVADPCWLETVMENFTDDRIAGVGGKMIEHFSDTLEDRWRAAHMPQHWGDRRMVNPNFLFGADNVYRRSAVESVNGFNEKYRTNFEDVDLCNRLKASGYTIIYEPRALARHYLRDTRKSLLKRIWGWGYSARDKNLRHAVAIVYRSTIDILKKSWKDLFERKDVAFALFDVYQGLYCMGRAAAMLIRR